jgi:Uma2 family endonuclease
MNESGVQVMTIDPERVWTEEEYLDFERPHIEKHEYYQGKVWQMDRGNLAHINICGNCIFILHSQLQDSPFFLYTGALRTKVSAVRLYTYADLMVTHGRGEFIHVKDDSTLLNPILLIEVLSPTTEAYDRGLKFECYRTLESLREYVLISQDRPRIEQYVWQSNHGWLRNDVSGLDSALYLSSIDCVLEFTDVYRRVFDEGNEEE